MQWQCWKRIIGKRKKEVGSYNEFVIMFVECTVKNSNWFLRMSKNSLEYSTHFPVELMHILFYSLQSL